MTEQHETTASTEPAWTPPWLRPGQALLDDRGRRAVTVLAVAVLCFWVAWHSFRTGDAPGASRRVVAAIARADSVSLRATDPTAGRGERMEAWADVDGFSRIEGRRGSALTMLWLRTSQWEVVFDPRERTEVMTKLPAPQETGDLLSGSGPVTARLGALLHALPAREVQEWRERSLLRGAREVIEAEGPAPAEIASRGWPFSAGEPMRLRIEADPRTSLPDRMVLSKPHRRGWRVITEATFWWNQEFPGTVYAFRPPRGTKVVTDEWSGELAEETVADGATAHWQVVLHAARAARDGTLTLLLSRQAREQSRLDLDSEDDMKVEGVDDAGREYSQYSCHASTPAMWGGYFRVVLTPNFEGEPGQWIDLKVYPSPSGHSANEAVALPSIPVSALAEEVAEEED